MSSAQAAALAMTDPVPVGRLVAVYDLGGTGLDATVLRRLPDGGYVPAGRPEELEVGGLDLDELVFDHVRAALGSAWDGLDPTDPAVLAGLGTLRRECTLAKESLSADTDVEIPVVLPGIDTRVRLARPEFEEMARPVIEETAATLQHAIAGAPPAAVLLTGGSARIPLITQVVSARLGRPVTVADQGGHGRGCRPRGRSVGRPVAGTDPGRAPRGARAAPGDAGATADPGRRAAAGEEDLGSAAHSRGRGPDGGAGGRRHRAGQPHGPVRRGRRPGEHDHLTHVATGDGNAVADHDQQAPAPRTTERPERTRETTEGETPTTTSETTTPPPSSTETTTETTTWPTPSEKAVPESEEERS